MKMPCAMRRVAKIARLGATDSKRVGTASRARLIQMPRLRSMRPPRTATARLDTAMPRVHAFTARPMAAWVTEQTCASAGSSAWVANRSTSVRNAVRAMTFVRAAKSPPSTWGRVGEGEAVLRCETVIARFPHPDTLPPWEGQSRVAFEILVAVPSPSLGEGEERRDAWRCARDAYILTS